MNCYSRFYNGPSRRRSLVQNCRTFTIIRESESIYTVYALLQWGSGRNDRNGENMESVLVAPEMTPDDIRDEILRLMADGEPWKIKSLSQVVGADYKRVHRQVERLKKEEKIHAETRGQYILGAAEAAILAEAAKVSARAGLAAADQLYREWRGTAALEREARKKLIEALGLE